MVVSATLVYQNHAVAGEILVGSRGQMLASHWIVAVHVVIPAALVDQRLIFTSEIGSLVGTCILIAKWTLSTCTMNDGYCCQMVREQSKQSAIIILPAVLIHFDGLIA